MRIGMMQDYSYLFSGMNQSKNSNTSAASMNWLGDYASIKNGSYGKLMKAYYSEASHDRVSSLAKDSVKKTGSELKGMKAELSKVQTGADALKKSAEALAGKGANSVFEKEDKNAVYDAVSSFVKGYNDTVKAAGASTDRNVTSRVNSMTGNTGIYAKALEGVGITIGEDKTLSINRDTFDQADPNKIKNLFQGNGTFGYQTSVQASMIASAAENKLSETGLYTAGGTQQFSTGNLFNYFM